MDFLKAVNIIGRDLEEAMTLLEQLGVSGPDKAEIELARSRVRSAADLVRLLPSLTESKENKEHVAPQNEVEVAKRKNTKAASSGVTKHEAEAPGISKAEAGVHQVIQAEDEAEIEFAGTAPVAAGPAITAAIKTEPVNAEHVITGFVKSEPIAVEVKSQEPSKGILADRFIAGGTLGEKISNGKKEEVVSSVIHSKPIADIASAIGINDRFYFIRELFSGDALAYGDTIKRLNAAASLGEAMKILDESTVMGSDPAAQSSFVDVVRRKFSLNV